MITAGSNYIQKIECPVCHQMVRTWTHIENCLGSETEVKNYGVMASGQGSRLKLDKTVSGEIKHYTLREAVESARHWDNHADTIGGYAKVIDLKTNKFLAHH